MSFIIIFGTLSLLQRESVCVLGTPVSLAKSAEPIRCRLACRLVLWTQGTIETRVNTGTTHTHTHPFNGPLSGTTRVGRYQKGKTNLDFTEARDSEWQWHQLGYMQVCTSLQADNHTSTPTLSFLQAGCPSCCPTNSVKALKAKALKANE